MDLFKDYFDYFLIFGCLNVGKFLLINVIINCKKLVRVF